MESTREVLRVALYGRVSTVDKGQDVNLQIDELRSSRDPRRMPRSLPSASLVLEGYVTPKRISVITPCLSPLIPSWLGLARHAAHI
jgi:hypothetical protein